MRNIGLDISNCMRAVHRGFKADARYWLIGGIITLGAAGAVICQAECPFYSPLCALGGALLGGPVGWTLYYRCCRNPGQRPLTMDENASSTPPPSSIADAQIAVLDEQEEKRLSSELEEEWVYIKPKKMAKR